MYRLYLWFLGVPEDRPIGVWWFVDQPSVLACQLFLSDCMIYLQAYSIVHESKLDHKELYIKPPPGAEIVYPNKRMSEWEKV